MKKFLLIVFGIFLWMGSFGQSFHTVSFSGSSSDFNSSELYSAAANNTDYYVTFDANYIYIGAFRTNSNTFGSADNLAIYIDTDPNATPTSGTGTTTGQNYNNVTGSLPFSANYNVHVEQNYQEARDYASSWANTISGLIYWTSTTAREVKIPLSSIGNPTSLYITMWMGYNGGMYSNVPGSNISASSNPTITDYFGGFGISSAGCYPTGVTNVAITDLLEDANPASGATYGKVSITSGSYSASGSFSIASGGSIVIGSGTTLDLGSNTVTMGSGSTIDNSGTFTAGSATVNFSGSGTVSGSSAITFNNVEIAGGVVLNGNSTIGNKLTINTGGYLAQSAGGSGVTSETDIPNYSSGATLAFTGSFDINSLASGWGTTTNKVPSNFAVEGTGSVTLSLARSTQGNITVATGATFDANSNLTLLSTSSGTGALIVSGSGTTSGSATVQRYFTGSTESWHLVSSSVASQAISGNWTPSGSYGDGTGYDFYAYDEATATWLNQKVGGNNITSFSPGSGYLVAYQAANPTNDFVGTLNNGDVQVSLSKQSSGNLAGANLIGNPYPSAIDWSNAFSGSSSPFADYYAYVYDATAGGGAGDYVTVNGAVSGAYISPGQGFFAIAATDGSTFTFTNSMRVSNTSTFYKSTATTNQVVLRLSGSQYYNEATVQVIENSHDIRDPYDALKFSSYNTSAPQIWSYTTDDVKVAINSYPTIDSAQTVQLGVYIPADGNYRISLEDQTGVFNNEQMILKDLSDNSEINLTQDGSFSFTAVKGDSKRFVLTINGTTGINNPTAEDQAMVYALNKSIYIKAKNNQSLNGEVTLNNILGQVVYRANLNGSTQQTLHTNLNTGVYIVRMELEDGTMMAKKVVIK
ncbi:MAG: T9SS type A sorting domain-containing protein [Bacteroidales bacterium]|nr:T9SS type A sorting domain-containing protein [Bacteroidales bacterium]